MDTQTVPWQPGVLLRGGQLSGGVPNFFFLYPFFKPLKISLKFTLTPTLMFWAVNSWRQFTALEEQGGL